MKYEIFIRKSAQKSLASLQIKDYESIKKAILELSDNPRPIGYIKLTNCAGYRIRVGNYRIIYEIIDKKLEIIVLLIGHRREIYE